MSFIKFILIFFILFITNCSGNKVSNYHGANQLEAKYEKLKINLTNKNDILKIIGPPSSKSDFDKNKWFYIERLNVNQSLFKLGTKKLKKNNILVVELDTKGILINKTLLDLSDMNDLKFFNKITNKEFENNSIMYNVFSTLREKINSPVRKSK